ncbi:membrane dipeptidase [Mesorhizobium sp. M1A.F.Ca.IN.020.30.1.1]|uniref:dipeptidase n=1 Tax=unclassified Mesorhizobium TaxID=325217 RepID=UPI000FD4B896|nr:MULTISPECIES: membrane dipeptidase [unclassified Mesorhizobium]RUV77935.1 membrane dipeptidase [Mesorhizobium sp. M1A.F.Ca.IN.020.30.1.1]RWG43290.1 MAG: membrane dipeptidase [Mesorhizobium sp.]RWG75463.1 MAG: membrane dipeptidase [Mesorhizobium sp.]TIM76254.1 MAG: membrane dipeptidase [Mesorhizobium sp.]TIM93189.1 MAG: membrane dipeptidase [Mesorhizobium sp.]
MVKITDRNWPGIKTMERKTPMKVVSKDSNISRDAAKLLANALIYDSHCGVACFPDLDLDFLSRWDRGGATFISLNVGWDALHWEESLRCAAHYHRWLSMHPDEYVIVDKVADIYRAKREGKLAVALDLEGANALNKNIEMIPLYHRLGIRHMNLAYNKNNEFAGGCTDSEDIPLTALGRAAIAEMNRIGMMVDCTHTGYRSSMDIMEISSTPVIFTHSNPRSLWDHKRNIWDDQIKACAQTGGVVGIVGVSKFMGDEKDCNSDTFVKHIDYVVNLVGIDHVGLGLDAVLDPQETPKLCKIYQRFMPIEEAEDWSEQVWNFILPEDFSGIAEGLLARGYGDDDVKKVMGGNFIRVASQVWG